MHPGVVVVIVVVVVVIAAAAGLCLECPAEGDCKSSCVSVWIPSQELQQ